MTTIESAGFAGRRARSQRRFQPVEEELAVGQAGEIVVHGVVQQPLLGGLVVGDVGERADQPHDFAVGADDRARLAARTRDSGRPARAQAEVLRLMPAAPLLDHAVERGAEEVAVARMDDVEPVCAPGLPARRA